MNTTISMELAILELTHVVKLRSAQGVLIEAWSFNFLVECEISSAVKLIFFEKPFVFISV